MNVPIPERMRHLPLDRRGYPVPVTVLRDADGRPHFTVNDERERQRIIRQDRCSICGHKLFRGRWFVGGPGAAFHDQGMYIDPPMHHDCARYALQVCPYLAAPSYSKRIDAKTLDADKLPSNVAGVFIDQTMFPDRPEIFVAVMATGQRLIAHEPPIQHIVQYIQPRRPYSCIEYWANGTVLAEPIGRTIASAALAKLDQIERKSPELILAHP